MVPMTSPFSNYVRQRETLWTLGCDHIDFLAVLENCLSHFRNQIKAPLEFVARVARALRVNLLAGPLIGFCPMRASSAGPIMYYRPEWFSMAMSLRRSNREGRKTQAVNSIINKGIMDKAQDPQERIKPTATGEQGDQQEGGR